MRVSIERTMMDVAKVLAKRSTCARRQCGCVLINHHNHILATGYNGVAAGLPHCTDRPCPGANFPSGEGLDACQAIHAEANALLQCRDTQSITECFSTTAPCVHCVKLLMNTSCRNIYFLEDYPHAMVAKQLWESTKGRSWIDLNMLSTKGKRKVKR